LSELQEIPIILKGDRIFEKVFEVAKFTNLTKKEMNAHWLARKDYWDHIHIMEYAEEQGEKRGERKGRRNTKLAIAHKMLQKNIKLSTIQELTGLSKETILALKIKN